MRSLSSAAVQSLFSSQTDEVWVMLISIEHPDMTTIQVTSNSEDTIHRSDTYVPYPFEMRIPSDEAGTQPVMELAIDNVDRLLVQTIRSLTSSPDVTVKFVLADSPDTVELGPFVFQMINVTYDQMSVTGTLAYQDVFREPYPSDRFTPVNFPGLF